MEENEYIKNLVNLAENNNEDALYTLCNLLDNGYDLDNTSELEYRWYLVLATKYEDTEAMFCLYELYKKGIYVSKNEEEALRWLMKGVNCDDTCALKEVINYYFNIKNYEEVMKNYERLMNVYLNAFGKFSIDDIVDYIDDECLKYIMNNYNRSN